MPTSSCEQISDIVALTRILRPRRVLDLGTGFGKYGLLAREYLELRDDSHGYADWQHQIDGVEAFEAYVTPVHHFVYDRLWVGDILEILPTLEPGYDLTYLIDVLEHFTYDDGCRVLEECRRISRNALISTPLDIGEQEEAFGNPMERHLFQWEEEHFERFPQRFRVRMPSALVVFAGEDAPRVEKEFRRDQLTSLKRRFPGLRVPLNLVRLFRR
jgi:SAM-dependent methyltransferase